MEDQQFFDLAFISVLSMQFHPANADNVKRIPEITLYASQVALEACKQRAILFGEIPCPGSQPAPQ